MSARQRLRASLRALWTFRGERPLLLAFLAARLLIAPLRGLDGELRGLGGRVLSVGCGYGVLERYLTAINPHVTVEGLDLDRSRVVTAARTAARAPRVGVTHADVMALNGDGGFDAVLAVDVLHHVPAGAHGPVIAALRRSLRPGGICLVKEIATRPAWRYRVNQLHDRLVAGPEPTFCRSPEDMSRLVSAEGLEVASVRRVGRMSPYPHYVVIARRAPEPPQGS
jgi:2-polyprenyl-3-methyl-5-hydroxy-6-metoxy-1,4-benzoquinol methylase